MTRKKRKHVAIPNKSLRKSILEKSRDCLFRKAKELSTLCDVEVGVIIQDQEKKEEFVWPSHHEVQEKLLRFMNVPAIDRNKKFSTHESFLTGTVSKIVDHTRRVHEKNDKKESECLMHELMKGKITIKELDMLQTNKLIQLMLEKLKQCNRRIAELDMIEQNENQSLPKAVQQLPSFVQMRGSSKASGVWGSGTNAIFPAPGLTENYNIDQRSSGYGSNVITLDKNGIHDFKDEPMFIHSQTNADLPNPESIEDLEHDNSLKDMMFNKQSNSFSNCANDIGFDSTNAGSNEGNNVVNHNTAGSRSGGNHMDFTPPVGADPSFRINDGFPDVEWPYIYLP